MVAAGVGGQPGIQTSWGQWCRCRPRRCRDRGKYRPDTARAVGNTDFMIGGRLIRRSAGIRIARVTAPVNNKISADAVMKQP